MIDYIKGNLTELTPTYVVVENSGIGYHLNISLSTYTRFEGKNECKILVHEIIREDSHQLFGFADKEERDIFRLLISVSGVGAGTASSSAELQRWGASRPQWWGGGVKPRTQREME